MPRKIRQLISDLEKHGFCDRGGKGSHRNFRKLGDDAKHYQEREVKLAIQRANENKA